MSSVYSFKERSQKAGLGAGSRAHQVGQVSKKELQDKDNGREKAMTTAEQQQHKTSNIAYSNNTVNDMLIQGGINSQGSAFRPYQKPNGKNEPRNAGLAGGGSSNDSQVILQQLSQSRQLQTNQMRVAEEASQSTRFKSFTHYFEKKRSIQAIENSERQTLTLGAAPGTVIGNEQDQLTEEMVNDSEKDQEVNNNDQNFNINTSERIENQRIENKL